MMNSEDSARLELNRSAPAVPAYAWVILSVVWLAGIAAPLNQFKVPPVMTILMETYRLDLTSAGWLMSVFAIMGLLLALPAGVILQKLGARLTGLIALGCLTAGSLISVMSPQVWLLFAGRLVEGCGMGLIAVLAPAVISAWFPPERRGLPMGIWATWVSMGSLLIYNLAPTLNFSFGWQSIWYLGAAYSLLILILFARFIYLPVSSEKTVVAQQTATFTSLKHSLENRNLWLLAFSFACFNGVVIGVIATYYPTFLTTMRAYSLAEASLVTSLKMVVVITTAPLIGSLCDQIGSPKKVLLFSMLILGIFSLFPFSSSGWVIPVLMAFLGILAGAIPTATFSSVAALMQNQQNVGFGMAVIMVGQNLGQLILPLIFSRMVEQFGWANAGYSLIFICAIAMLSIHFIKINQV